jgi:5-methylcytosine-specific restriction enzyme subunit McrC
VGGFYKVVLPSEWRVKPGRKLSWQVEDPSPGILNFLPNMVTDIVLDHKPSGQRLVIDTKFNDIFTKGRYGNTWT